VRIFQTPVPLIIPTNVLLPFNCLALGLELLLVPVSILLWRVAVSSLKKLLVSLHKLGISWDKYNGETFILFLDSEFRSWALHCRNEQHTQLHII
jgi:hypothetical protein